MPILPAIASFLIAVLSGLGVGSGRLLVIYLSLVEALPQLEAQGINLLFFLFSASSSLLLHITHRKILFGVVLLMSICGIVGAPIGSFIALRLPGAILRRAFGGMLILMGILSLRRSAKQHSKKEKPEKFTKK